jgi:hypothetical protein
VSPEVRARLGADALKKLWACFDAASAVLEAHGDVHSGEEPSVEQWAALWAAVGSVPRCARPRD